MRLFSLVLVCLILGALISATIPGIGGFILCLAGGWLLGSQWDKIYDKIDNIFK